MANAAADSSVSAVAGAAGAAAEMCDPDRMEAYFLNMREKYRVPGYEEQYNYWNACYEECRRLRAEAAKERQRAKNTFQRPQ